MKSLRTMINDFIYPFLERFTDMVYKGGEDTVFHGVRVLDDDIKFTHGALVNAAATLYVYYANNGDDRADEVLARLHYFIEIAASNVCKTWGKLAILRGFNTLYEEGLLDRVDPGYISLVKEKTNYEDFFDKETLELKGMATNYFHVAMACAGFREKFGWENDGYADRIKEKLLGIMESKSENGWLDDELPYGRFDRYSFVLSSEFADTASAVGLEVPETIKSNLRKAAEAILFMANAKGDGVCYGRSLSCHGDATAPEVLSSAFAEGLIQEDERDVAIAYCIKVYEKIFSFWYNEEKGCFDIWWGGRASNSYRPVERILETNIDIANHLYMALKNFENAGVADIIPKYDLPHPEKWQVYELDFINRADDVKKTIIMRREDTLLMLPFVGLGKNWGRKNAYYAFPAICKVLEASPESTQPFMIPEYTDENGTKYRPCQFYDSVEVRSGDDTVEVHAQGYLNITDENKPKKSDIRFNMSFTVTALKIEMRVSVAREMPYAEMVTGANDGGARITVLGFNSTTAIDTAGRTDFNAIHGAIAGPKLHTAKNPRVLGYIALI